MVKKLRPLRRRKTAASPQRMNNFVPQLSEDAALAVALGIKVGEKDGGIRSPLEGRKEGPRIKHFLRQ